MVSHSVVRDKTIYIYLLIDTYLSSVPHLCCRQSLAEGVTVFPRISVQSGRWVPVYGEALYIGDKSPGRHAHAISRKQLV